jgi:hypothetical protein
MRRVGRELRVHTVVQPRGMKRVSTTAERVTAGQTKVGEMRVNKKRKKNLVDG